MNTLLDVLRTGQPARYASRSFLSMPRTPEAMFFDNFAAIGLARQRTLLSPLLQKLMKR